MKKFAIQVPFEDGWLFVVDEEQQIVLHDTIKIAKQFGEIWKKSRILIFDENDNNLNQEYIIDTKDYLVFKNLINDAIYFKPKHRSWQHLQKCFEVACQWGYEQYKNDVCENYSIVYDVIPNSIESSSIKLILRK